MAEAFLSEPGAVEAKRIERVVLETGTHPQHEDHFEVKTKDFTAQYAQLYCMRLKELRSVLERRAGECWGSAGSGPNREGEVAVTPRILQVHIGKPTVIVGTLFKEMALRPDLIEHYTQQRGIIGPPPKGKFISDTDHLVLEDEGARIKLILPTGTDGCDATPAVPSSAMERLCVDELVTGMTVALKGQENVDGEFEVEDIMFCGLGPQEALPKVVQPAKKMIAIACGFNVGHNASHNPLLTSMLFDYLRGYLGSPLDHERSASIGRLILAGNLFSAKFGPSGKPPSPSQKRKNKGRSVEEHDEMVAPLREIDGLLAELASSLEVDVMPGENDPSNYSLPQQPFNRCLFHSASRYQSFACCTNPYDQTFEGCRVFGSSGQTVNDLKQYMSIQDPLRLLQLTLELRHWAPTAPDTLAAYPFYDRDPFVMHRSPHVYFAANQEKFDTKMLTGPEGQRVRLISVPSFSQTGTVVLVDLHSLEATPLTFSSTW